MKPFLFAVLLTSLSASAATRTVTLATDAKTPTAGMLRYELANAADGDTIVFDASLAGATINLISCDTMGGDASLVISNKNLTIEGPAGGITLDGGWSGASKADNGTRILFIENTDGATVAIKNVNFVNGHGRLWGKFDKDRLQGYYPTGAIFSFGPLALTNCVFRKNGSGDYMKDNVYDGKGGGAIYAENDLSVYGCTFLTNAILEGTSSYGGAILQTAGSCRIANSKFIGNYSNSFGGGVIATTYAGLDISDCTFVNNHSAHRGGTIYNKTNNGKPISVRNTVFRGSYDYDDWGGVMWAETSGRMTFVNCEFDECTTPSCGGAIRTCNGDLVLVNSTFHDCAGCAWGGVIDARKNLYMVNCTVTGTTDFTAESQGGCILGFSGIYLLNTVAVYNRYRAGDATNCTTDWDVRKYQQAKGTGVTRYRSICNGLQADGTTALDLSQPELMFADAVESKSSVAYCGSTKALCGTFDFPVLAEDPDNLYRSRIVAIKKGGLLDRTGYPVKANADYTYIAYSTDDGATWTKLCGTDDGTATRITTDQRGVAYYKGKTPIGAATYVGKSLGMMILYR